jgi:hypothetical protein
VLNLISSLNILRIAIRIKIESYIIRLPNIPSDTDTLYITFT